MAIPFHYKRQLVVFRRRLRQVPPWALLSLSMNGVLFFTVLVMLMQSALIRRATMLPQANAFTSVAEAKADQPVPKLNNRIHMDYEQWTRLLDNEAAAAAARNAPHQTILLGDSLTLWFPQDLLPGRKTWLNQAISGEKSAGVRQRLYILDQTDPEAVFIMIGINDMIWGRSDADLLENVRAIVQYLRSTQPQAKIVVQSILPHGGENATWEGKDKLAAVTSDRILAVNDSLRAIAEDNGGYFLNLYPLFVNGEGHIRADLTTDGVHLNTQGYMIWRSAIALFEETELGETPDN